MRILFGGSCYEDLVMRIMVVGSCLVGSWLEDLVLRRRILL